MRKFFVFVVVLLLGLLIGWWVFTPIVVVGSEAEGVEMRVGKVSEWRKLLSDVGWSKWKNLTLPTGERVPTRKIAKIKVVYTQEEQTYLPQKVSEKGKIIGSVGVERNGPLIILRVQADPTWLAQKSGQARDWRVAHQAVWMLYRMTHGQEMTDKELPKLFGDWQGRKLLELQNEN